MGDKYAPFQGWNHRLVKHIFPELVNWVLSIGDEYEEPHYEQPSEDELKEALLVIVKKITEKRDDFQKVYNELVANEPRNVVGWNFASFVQGYFDENVKQDNM